MHCRAMLFHECTQRKSRGGGWELRNKGAGARRVRFYRFDEKTDPYRYGGAPPVGGSALRISVSIPELCKDEFSLGSQWILFLSRNKSYG